MGARMADDGITIGMDVGTTAVKAGVVAQDGRVLALHRRGHGTQRGPGGVARQNPDDWVTGLSDALTRFAAEGHRPDAIGMCSQVNTHVFVDAEGGAVMPAILWQDGRASAEAAELDSRVTEAQKLEWWGTPMPIDASHALPRMLWVARHHPDIWAKTRYVMLPKDYCLLALTGEVATDPLANIGLVDGALQYIPDLFDLVPGALEKMAPLVAHDAVAGRVKTGLPFAGCPVVNGSMDAWAGLVGAGGAAPGAAVYLSGTSEILGINSHIVHPTPGAIVFPDCAGIRLHAAPTQSGGDAQAWYAGAHGIDLPDMATMATERSGAVPMFLPQLEGERAPVWNADLRGAFLGVTRATTQGDFARAVYEGVAMAARWGFETLEASSGVTAEAVNCGGGGFRADIWGQIRADIFGCELRRLEAGEPGILGAAAMAAVAVGTFDDLHSATTALARFDTVFSPNAQAHDVYSELFSIYKSAVMDTAEINKSVAKTRAGIT
jgi:xylulokinase